MTALAFTTSQRTAAPTPAVVLIGQQGDAKPRGSWFGKDDLTDAKKAAQLSGLKIVSIRSDRLRKLAFKVPRGRIFSSGKAFTPLIQSSVYDALLPHAANAPEPKGSMDIIAQADGGDAAISPGKGKAAEEEKHEDVLPKDWGSISLGNTVLAYSSEDEAWFEAIVTRVDPNGKLVLRWRDYPDQPTIMRQRHQLGLLYPEGKTATA